MSRPRVRHKRQNFTLPARDSTRLAVRTFRRAHKRRLEVLALHRRWTLERTLDEVVRLGLVALDVLEGRRTVDAMFEPVEPKVDRAPTVAEVEQAVSEAVDDGPVDDAEPEPYPYAEDDGAEAEARGDEEDE